MKIKLSEQAKADLIAAYEYYKSKEKSLANRFKVEFYSKIEELKKVPSSGSFIFDNVRYRVLKIFPYIVLYEIQDKRHLVILRIFNTSQKPSW